MKKLVCFALIFGLLLASAGMASEDMKNGEFDVMYYAGALNGSATNLMDSKTASGYIARFDYFLKSPFKLGMDYTTNTNRSDRNSVKIDDLKINIKYVPYRASTANFSIGLFYNSLRFDAAGAGATYNGIGLGLDGRTKISKKTDLYGIINYAPSLKGSPAGVDTKLRTTSFEMGFNFRTQESMMIKLGYRTNQIKNTTSANSDITINGLLVGFGFDF